MSEAGPAERVVTACVLIIGNEILSGPGAGRQPGVSGEGAERGRGPAARGAGHPGRRRRPSSRPSTRCGAKFDYVFTTGGIGPTHDDITAQCIADAFGVPLILHPEAKRLLESHYPPGAHQRGAAAHGAHAGRLGVAAQPDLARAGLPDRQCVRDGRRAAGHAGDLQRIAAPAARRRQGAEPQRQLRPRRGHDRQGSGGVAGSATPTWRSAPTPISGAAISASRWWCAAPTGERIAAAIEELKALIRTLGGDPQEGLAED